MYVQEFQGMHFLNLRCEDLHCVNDILYFTFNGLYVLKGGSWVLLRKFLQESVQNPAILDTSNEFICLHKKVRSGLNNKEGRLL